MWVIGTRSKIRRVRQSPLGDPWFQSLNTCSGFDENILNIIKSLYICMLLLNDTPCDCYQRDKEF
jgi:hypothetical protein